MCMSPSLASLNWVIQGIIYGSIMAVTTGDTGSLDYSSKGGEDLGDLELLQDDEPFFACRGSLD